MTIMTMIVICCRTDAFFMSPPTWTVAQAKAKFSEVIDRALTEGPQTVTRKGRTAVVVVDAAEWQRKTKRVGTLADFFAASPLRGSGLKLPRRTLPRRVDL
jgi:prevent-host-death family protein